MIKKFASKTPARGTRSLKSAVAGLSMALAALTMGATSANAILMVQDLNAGGDGLLTVDSITGLEWLDLTETQGLTYDAAEATAFVTGQGFRHANVTEVAALFANAGIPNVGSATLANFTPVSALIDLLGCTSSCASTISNTTSGLVDFDPFLGAVTDAASLTRFLRNSTGEAIPGAGSFINKSVGSAPSIGNFLVRAGEPTGGGETSLPEPATLLLFGVALSGLAAVRRRRCV